MKVLLVNDYATETGGRKGRLCLVVGRSRETELARGLGDRPALVRDPAEHLVLDL